MNLSPNHSMRSHGRETGALLITAMIFLMIITMIVISMLSGGTLEERMARNDRDRRVATQAAEALLRDVEVNVLTQAPFSPYVRGSFSANCANGFCTQFDPQAMNAPRWQIVNWESDAVTRTFANNAANIDGVDAQPRYIVELVVAPSGGGNSTTQVQGCSPGVANIITRSVGRDNAEVFLQSTVRFPSSGGCD